MPTFTDDVTKKPERGGNYWGGFAAGAAIGTGAAVAAYMIANLAGKHSSRVVRLEDSVQIQGPEGTFTVESDEDIDNLKDLI